MAILVPPPQRSSQSDRTSVREADGTAWRMLGWLGMALTIMGAADILLAWYPTAFGTVEWEFGAISSTLNGLALPILGLVLVLCSALARNRAIAARSVSVVLLVLAATLIALAVIYATDAPLALRAVDQNPALLGGIQKAITKAAMLFVAYPTLLVAVGVYSWRSTRRTA